jgi:hypothetical protein
MSVNNDQTMNDIICFYKLDNIGRISCKVRMYEFTSQHLELLVPNLIESL